MGANFLFQTACSMNRQPGVRMPIPDKFQRVDLKRKIVFRLQAGNTHEHRRVGVVKALQIVAQFHLRSRRRNRVRINQADLRFIVRHNGRKKVKSS